MVARRNNLLRAGTARATEFIASPLKKNAVLRADVRELKAEKAVLASLVETLEVQLEKLCSTRSVLSKALFGSKSKGQKNSGAQTPYRDLG